MRPTAVAEVFLSGASTDKHANKYSVLGTSITKLSKTSWAASIPLPISQSQLKIV